MTIEIGSQAGAGAAVSAVAHTNRNTHARLPARIKFYQAIGALADTYKNFAFNTFLLLLYSQILGLSASMASLALMIAMVFDAVTDPVVGSFSDGLRSPLGRRHPLMYASVLPLGVSLYLLFVPPAGLDQTGLFLWLLIFAAAARGAMTLFLVPWTAMFAELSADYLERSAIISYRYVVGAVGALVFFMATWTWVFPNTSAHPVGQLNPEAYPDFALLLALAVSGAVLLTTALTHSQISRLRQSPAATAFGLRSVVRDLLVATRNREFLILFAGLLISSIITGVVAAYEIYFQTYFWGLTADDLRWLSLGALGALVGAVMVPWLQELADKKYVLLGAMMFSLVDGITIVTLRMLDILPPNGDPLLLQILVVNEVFRAIALAVTVIMFLSMVADTLDLQELETGRRQEGVFSAAISFSGKAVSGMGVLVVGFLLDYVVGLPTGTAPDEVSTEVVTRLGIVGGYLVPLLYLFPFYMTTRYGISRARFANIQRAIAARTGAEDGEGQKAQPTP